MRCKKIEFDSISMTFIEGDGWRGGEGARGIVVWFMGVLTHIILAHHLSYCDTVLSLDDG